MAEAPDIKNADPEPPPPTEVREVKMRTSSRSASDRTSHVPSYRPTSEIDRPPSALELAVTQFDIGRVAALLEDPDVDVTEVNAEGHNVLHELVLRYVGLDVHRRHEVRDDFTEILAKVVEGGLDVNSPVKQAFLANLKTLKTTALHMAACHHDTRDVITALVTSGAKVNSADGHRQTALHLATDGGLLRNMEALLGAGADPNTTDEYGQTPLHLAVKGRRKPLDLTKTLLKAGATPDARDTTKRTPLHLATKHTNYQAVSELIQSGSDVNSVDGSGLTAAHYACTYDCSGKILPLLLSAQADMNLRDHVRLETPLHKAVRHHMTENLVTLCTSGVADTNTPDQAGDTVLHSATVLPDWALWTALLQAGGDVQKPNAQGASSLQLLKSHSNKLATLIELRVGETEEIV